MPLLISILIGIFCTLCYLIDGAVPDVIYFNKAEYHHWIFSRWWDIPTSFVCLSLIQSFLIPASKRVDDQHDYDFRYSVPIGIFICGLLLIIGGIVAGVICSLALN